MEIRNLLSFIRVAEQNSFTKAANILGYSQSTISFQIKQLEEELGCLLFERINHTISLTEKGAELLEYAQKICRMNEEFNQNFNLTKPVEGALHVLVPHSVCEQMIFNNYMDFHRKYPGISLKFTSLDTQDMFRMLDRNEADIMLTMDIHAYQSDYIIAKEQRVGIHFVTGADSPYATDKPLTIEQIVAMPFIATEKNTGYRRPLDELLAKKSIELTPILELERTDIIASVLEAGAGVAFLPDFATEKKVREGKLVYLNVVDASFEIWKQLLYHKNKWISRPLSALIEYIKENEFDN
ncbi:MAG: LysR family transcriptional regulator [Clostridia bacterium]|nr:LysR family transcriptional regulator [Clostridia bacterium]